MLCVGRGTIREAVKILESRNIVTVKQGAGTFVCEKYGVADDPLGLCLMENKEKAVKDLVDMRIIIEPEIAALAAQYAKEDDIRELETRVASPSRPTRAWHLPGSTLFHHQSSGVRNTTNLTGVRNYPHDGPRQRAYTSRIDEAQASDVVDTTVKG